MKPEDIMELKEPKLSSFESMFIPAILSGLGTTIRHFSKSIVGGDRTAAISGRAPRKQIRL